MLPIYPKASYLGLKKYSPIQDYCQVSSLKIHSTLYTDPPSRHAPTHVFMHSFITNASSKTTLHASKKSRRIWACFPKILLDFILPVEQILNTVYFLFRYLCAFRICASNKRSSRSSTPPACCTIFLFAVFLLHSRIQNEAFRNTLLGMYKSAQNFSKFIFHLGFEWYSCCHGN